MRYMRVDKADGKTNFIDRQDAKELLSRNYAENVCSFDEMLSIPNEYPCMFCTLLVIED